MRSSSPLSLLAQLCFTMAFPFAFPSPCWVLRGFLFYPSLGSFHPSGSLRAFLRAGPASGAGRRQCHLAQPRVRAPLGAPGRCCWQQGCFGAGIAARSLLMPSCQLRGALRSSLLPSSPLPHFHKQELSGLCLGKTEAGAWKQMWGCRQQPAADSECVWGPV